MSTLLAQVAEPRYQSTREKFPRQYNPCPYCGELKKRYAKACARCIIPLKRKQKRHTVPRPDIVQPDNPLIKLVPLTMGQVAEIDAIDYDRVMRVNWMAVKTTTICGFTASSAGLERINGKQVWTRLSNFILGLPREILIDHIDGNDLNHKRDNLRPATKQENTWNRSRLTTNTSGYMGVTRVQYRAQIMVDGRKINLGTFNDPAEAAKVRDLAALHCFGEFARLNFPELIGEYHAILAKLEPQQTLSAHFLRSHFRSSLRQLTSPAESSR
jgi:HNH endonuclease